MYEDDLIDIEKFLMHLQLMHIASMLGASGMHKSKKSIAYLKRMKELRLTITALIEKNAGGSREEELDNWRKESDDGADDGGVKCKTHPDAPHSFLRNSSHNAGRYVCECEHWEGSE
jgi:hypothetical protein